MAVHCFHCEKVFSSQSNLNRHLSEKHNISNNIVPLEKKNNFQCLNCDAIISFKNCNDLRMHLQEEHNIITETTELQFSSHEGKYTILKTNSYILTS